MTFSKKRWGVFAWVKYPLVGLVVVLAVHVRSAMADTGQAFLETDVGYVSGDFGSPVTSTLSYFQTNVGYVTSSYFLSIGVPYNFISSDEPGDSDAHGFGDLVIQGARTLYTYQGRTRFIGSAILKLPTADETKGLGTGGTDLGGRLTVTHFFSRFQLSVAGGYVSTGGAFPGQTEDGSYLYGVGVGRWFGKTQAAAAIEGRTSTFAGVEDPLELSLGALKIINKDYSLKGAALLGLSTGSPDYGFSVGLVRWF